LTYEFDLSDEELNEYTMRAFHDWLANYEIYDMNYMYDGIYWPYIFELGFTYLKTFPIAVHA